MKPTSTYFQTDSTCRALLREDWFSLVADSGAATDKAADLFESLAASYSEPHRAYHNLTHVRALLKTLDEFRDRIADRAAVRFAVWFHDAIYNPKRKDNEDRSAALARTALGELGIDEPTRALVGNLVSATKTHSIEGLPPDGAWFLDADLAILGASEAVYGEYAKAIRAEYSWVPWFLYRRSRGKVLKSFLSRPRLYFTDELAHRFEAQARRNLESEIKRLQGKS